MDYSVYDATRAGFTDVVFVIRRDMEQAFAPVAARYRGVRVATAHQLLDDPSRAKPWGTAHAVLATRAAVPGPFAVVNADDFYGAAAFAAAREALGRGEWAVVAYRLRDTLSESGGVSRAICRLAPGGYLQDIGEVLDIRRSGDSYHGRAAGDTLELSGDAPVSMNMWAFTPAVFDLLEQGFARFRPRAGRGDEYLLPTAIREAIGAGAAKVRVLQAGAGWLGITHQADRPGVEAKLRQLVAQGAYPAQLWPTR
jgi:hypothetical protein